MCAARGEEEPSGWKGAKPPRASPAQAALGDGGRRPQNARYRRTNQATALRADRPQLIPLPSSRGVAAARCIPAETPARRPHPRPRRRRRTAWPRALGLPHACQRPHPPAGGPTQRRTAAAQTAVSRRRATSGSGSCRCRVEGHAELAALASTRTRPGPASVGLGPTPHPAHRSALAAGPRPRGAGKQGTTTPVAAALLRRSSLGSRARTASSCMGMHPEACPGAPPP